MMRPKFTALNKLQTKSTDKQLAVDQSIAQSHLRNSVNSRVIYGGSVTTL